MRGRFWSFHWCKKKCDYENKMKLTTKTRKENRCVIDWNRWVGWFVHWRHAILFGRALNVKLGVHFLLLLLHLRFSSTNKNIFFFSGHNICFLSISLKTHAPWFLVYHPKKLSLCLSNLFFKYKFPPSIFLFIMIFERREEKYLSVPGKFCNRKNLAGTVQVWLF